ncbi:MULTISPECIES: DUF2235 domain-containing protein [Thalassobacter]|uniref:DUF2235 domain-containing protein n=1 Tax=Thalassobacter TaxID=266808 RepID=UPI0006899A01|nr:MULTISPECIES: DUF2235 domain-containing protein [Thalassobacter]
MRLSDRLRGWLKTRHAPSAEGPPEAQIHVVLLDGTMSSLTPGLETNVARIWRLLQEVPGLCLYYEPGIQWRGWRRGHEVMAGVGINRQIKRAYGFLAERYHPGDQIYFVGYSRGAYGVRALAGLINRIGLLRADAVNHGRLEEVYDLYRHRPDSAEARAFAAEHCVPKVQIDAVCVFDTVRALGIRWPLVWRFAPAVHEFHSNVLGRSVRRGFHALAMDETRLAYAPQLWEVPEHRLDDVKQVWFRGSHGDVGGHIGEFAPARGLGNVPLVWMLEQMEATGLPLPAQWARRFPQDATAPSAGSTRGFGKFFLARRRRVLGRDPSEVVHPSAEASLPRGVRLPRLETAASSEPETQGGI